MAQVGPMDVVEEDIDLEGGLDTAPEYASYSYDVDPVQSGGAGGGGGGLYGSSAEPTRHALFDGRPSDHLDADAAANAEHCPAPGPYPAGTMDPTAFKVPYSLLVAITVTFAAAMMGCGAYFMFWSTQIDSTACCLPAAACASDIEAAMGPKSGVSQARIQREFIAGRSASGMCLLHPIVTTNNNNSSANRLGCVANFTARGSNVSTLLSAQWRDDRCAPEDPSGLCLSFGWADGQQNRFPPLGLHAAAGALYTSTGILFAVLAWLLLVTRLPANASPYSIVCAFAILAALAGPVLAGVGLQSMQTNMDTQRRKKKQRTTGGPMRMVSTVSNESDGDGCFLASLNASLANTSLVHIDYLIGNNAAYLHDEGVIFVSLMLLLGCVACIATFVMFIGTLEKSDD